MGYRMDVEQGNVVTSEQVAQLIPGMTQQEIQFLLGTPLLKDPFHANQWEYIYSFRDGSTDTLNQQRLSLLFDNNLLVDVHYDPHVNAKPGVDSKP